MFRVGPEGGRGRTASGRAWRFRRPSALLRSRAAAMLMVLLLTGLVASLLATASQASSPGEPAVVVVQPGDTLWSVVSRHAPSRDPYGRIEEIRRLNDLSGHTIHPGQRLRLPDG